MSIANELRNFVEREGNWRGTVSQLVAKLEPSDERVKNCAPSLAVWLRRHEPTLWWDYGVSIRFSRTGQRRLVHLSARPVTTSRAAPVSDVHSISSAVTPTK